MELSVAYTDKEIRRIVLTNLSKMLFRRNLIREDTKLFKDEEVENLVLTKYSFAVSDGTKYEIYFINYKLTNIANNSQLDVYLKQNPETHKIIIIIDGLKKAIKQIMQDYNNAEFFFEHEMMEDIPDKHFIPEHQLLNDEQKRELLTKFSDNELAKILSTDIMSRYYAASVGDIFRIIRPSYLSGKNIFYRRVIQGNYDIF
jgi:DNA-directed RNA polymerase subunit H (RpoH/RPB5)